MRGGIVLKNCVMKENAKTEEELRSEEFFEQMLQETEQIRSQSIIEKEQIIQEGLELRNQILEEVENHKDNVMQNYEQEITERHVNDTTIFFEKKDKEFDDIITGMQNKWDNALQETQSDVLEILLTIYAEFFGEKFKDPQILKEVILNSFSKFDDVKEAQLVVDKNLYDDFKNTIASEIEEELEIRITSLKKDRNLKGFIFKTELGSVEFDLNKQIHKLKEMAQNN